MPKPNLKFHSVQLNDEYQIFGRTLKKVSVAMPDFLVELVGQSIHVRLRGDEQGRVVEVKPSAFAVVTWVPEAE